ncbi:ExbD/TolR family protein [Thiopseudomonas alkaliphila]|uniref:Biopolymer transporter ExbD n=1 Tax=Thiopseudomonas alkaliphila TaxID=1697053 RepID=A0AAW7DM00_9GAMM|nr:biopolymer transporter ExbD [Thiopseudomonas alkaliphila]AKX56068.1 hypothetical protein AKN90_10385 [Thiopseudomonas alkaliphila]MDM1695137.1 biopolymer transporter ExbD [Thiopseudomonas alkaliphila]MDM1707239.1 biopolymer transporter ExbD [Thiopseudomonas alkaliphila]MDM1717114.1 biopolymer transporter ExbD [Thiopseudomonas alkaliphila]
MIRLPPSISPNNTLLPDLTPLLDVIFIVLVFFLLTANQPLLEMPVDLPATEESLAPATAEQRREVIILDQTGQWYYRNRLQTDFASLKQQLISDAPQHLDLALHKQAPLADFLQLMALLNQLQITDTQILMETKIP